MRHWITSFRLVEDESKYGLVRRGLQAAGSRAAIGATNREWRGAASGKRAEVAPWRAAVLRASDTTARPRGDGRRTMALQVDGIPRGGY